MNPAKSEPIRVLIVDSDPLVCRALMHLLHGSAVVEVIATAGGDETLEMAGEFHPTVVLVDTRTAELGRVDGVNLMQSLCQELPATRIVALGVYGTVRDQALTAGACRFLLKDCSRDALVSAIRLAASEQCEGNGGRSEHTAAT